MYELLPMAPVAQVLATPVTGTVETEGMTLTVVSRYHGLRSIAASWVCPALGAVLTADGRGARLDAWHQGPESREAVYVERWGDDGRRFHGWVDSESRLLVQAG